MSGRTVLCQGVPMAILREPRLDTGEARSEALVALYAVRDWVEAQIVAVALERRAAAAHAEGTGQEVESWSTTPDDSRGKWRAVVRAIDEIGMPRVGGCG